MIAGIIVFLVALLAAYIAHRAIMADMERKRARFAEIEREEIRKEVDRTLAELAAEESRRIDREFLDRQMQRALDRFKATVEAKAALWDLEDGRKKLGIKPDLADVPTAQMIEELKRRKVRPCCGCDCE